MSKVFEDKLNSIIRKVQAYHPDPDVEMLRRAFTLAEKMHGEQRRRSGDLYLSHPLAVTDIIADMKLDIASLCAGLLHDIVEDTDISVDFLRENFNDEIAFIVDGVTKLSKLAFDTREERQAASFRKMLLAMSSDLRVILVKLADRLHNMRTLEHMPDDKKVRIARETLDIYAPLAHRLGIYWIKSELEDMAFRYLHSKDYYDLAKRVDRKKGEREKYIRETIKLIKGKLKDDRISAEVYGRPKHFYSIWRKMRDNNIDFEQVFDILAFRIICESQARCYEILGMIHSLWKPVPGRFKDYIAMPKRNGYQSLHTSVFGPYRERIEIQIRTEDMHEIAESGVAAHWDYKESKVKKKKGPNDDAKKFAWLRQLLEWQQDLADPKEFMDSVKVDLFGDEVYVLTPEGGIRVLPKGSSPLDFAYAIHTEVGHHCTGARVNGTMVPLKTELHTGDTVEILTSPHARPSKDWLQYVQSSRAKNKIRHHVRSEERERAREYGQELLEKDLKRYNAKLRKFQKSGQLKTVAEACRFQSVDELFVNLGFGKIQPETVIKRLLPNKEPTGEITKPKEGAFDKILRVFTGTRPGIAIDGVDDIMVRYARCCNPVPGDPIVGFVTRGRGLSIHTDDCSKGRLLDPERMIEVYWKTPKGARRPVTVRVICVDQPGLLAVISQNFYDMSVNITEAHCRTTQDGRAVNTFGVLVGDSKQLQRVLDSLNKINGVYSAERVRAS